MPIEPVARFIWLGPRLSPTAWLAVRAATDRGGFNRVVLHVDDPAIAADPLVADLVNTGVRLVREDGPARIAALSDHPDGAIAPHEASRLADLYSRAGQPAIAADLLRLAILFRDGGVYLDADAITLRDTAPVLEAPGFAGLEYICLPARVRDSHNPLRWAHAGALMAVRDVLSRTSGGHRGFDRVSKAYHVAANNAVLGSMPRHPVIGEALRTAASYDDARALRLYQLGPKLLEKVTDNRSRADFRMHPPQAFYPLSPEISWHYFKPSDLRPETVFGERTWCAHLYDSVVKRRLGHGVTVDWLRQTRQTTLFSRMVEPWLDRLFALVPAQQRAAR